MGAGARENVDPLGDRFLVTLCINLARSRRPLGVLVSRKIIGRGEVRARASPQIIPARDLHTSAESCFRARPGSSLHRPDDPRPAYLRRGNPDANASLHAAGWGIPTGKPLKPFRGVHYPGIEAVGDAGTRGETWMHGKRFFLLLGRPAPLARGWAEPILGGGEI